jgi:hypothetical protein
LREGWRGERKRKKERKKVRCRKTIAYKLREAPVPNHQSPNPPHPSLQLMDNMEERDQRDFG